MKMSSINVLIIWAVIFNILTNLSLADMSGTFLKGNKIPCNEEGKLVDIPFLRYDPCITCMCINSEIDCFRDTCQETVNCYHYHPSNDSSQIPGTTGCCRKCLSCRIGSNNDGEDKILNNGDIYHDVCKTYHCNSGTLTVSQAQCHVPCRKPIFFPGQCCPSCKACPASARDGDEIPVPNDKCVRCYCFKGQMICTKKNCPVLPCPRSEWINSTNSCCPVCRGSVVIDPEHSKRGSCLINGQVYRHLEKFIHDECTTCECLNSTSVCHRRTCQQLTCAEQVTDPGHCCPRCADDEETKNGIAKESSKNSLDCIHQNRHLKNGEYTDPCKQCRCIQGRIECDNSICPRDFVCPQGHRKARINGECCESCVPEDGKCLLQWLKGFSVNISTYDGKNYQLNEPCNHVLTRDCETKRFSVHLINKFRNNSSPEIEPIYRGTSLMVRIDTSRIMLSHLGRVRINRTLVHLPYIQMGQFSIVQMQDRIKLHSVIGLNILWNRNKTIEIKIKSRFRDQTCGLCGNFNLDDEDEFQTKNSKQITTLNRFVQSYKVGQNARCPKTKANTKAMLVESSPNTCPDAVRVCNRLKQRHRKCGPNTNQVYRQCLEDMCHCQPGDRRCHCYIIKNFIKGCEPDPNSADLSFCQSLQCPPGSEFRFCSFECRKTCQYREQNCRRKQCRSGCECIGNRVWFHGQCIPEVMCPI